MTGDLCKEEKTHLLPHSMFVFGGKLGLKATVGMREKRYLPVLTYGYSHLLLLEVL